jgi:hypothetical protein
VEGSQTVNGSFGLKIAPRRALKVLEKPRSPFKAIVDAPAIVSIVIVVEEVKLAREISR